MPVTENSLDAEQGLVLPPFVEPHIHLDTTQTAGQPNWNQSGTLFEGIERWAERKALLTHDDVKQRAWQTLKWQIANGIQHVRTHVDVSDATLTALKAMLEVKQEVAPWIDLQIVAFPQEGILSYPNGEALLEEALRLGADVVGAIPHFEFTREYGVESLHKTFALAQKYDRLIDVHCDEIDDEQSRFVETVAALAHREGMGARVTASHTTAMHSYNGAYTSRLFRLLKCPVLTLSPTRWSIFICKDVSIRIQNVAASRALKRCWSPALTSALVTMMSSIRGIRWERRICCKCCIWGCMFAN